MVQFTVPGMPRGKGRPRFAGHAYTDSRTREYEALVQACYRREAGAYDFPGPVEVSIAAVIPIAKGDSRRTRNDKLTGRMQPTRKPDVDNIAKAVMDALNGLAWQDDKQVVRLSVCKRYGEEARTIVCVDDG